MAASRPHTLSFADLGLPAILIDALTRAGITEPFPIQAATLPDSLAGRDVLGRGRTGSGKTYAFVLPILARLAAKSAPRRPGHPRALILAPTRELANQIHDTLAPLAKALRLTTMTIFGGVGANPQISGLRGGADIVVACPGRLADLVRSGHASLDAVEITVLDEADHMADLGFLPIVRRLLDMTPRGGQRMLFSATLDSGVDVIVQRFMDKPVTHSVDSSLSPVAAMTHHVLHVRADDRVPVLVDLAAAPGRTLVFTRTKRGAKILTRRLNEAGVPAVELHGNLGQNARERNLTAFAESDAGTLVATDIAARGIHVDDVHLVIHADPPVEHKSYLHRSGRTARAGASGTVVTLMTDDQVADVRTLTRKAGINPTTTRLRPGDPLLNRLAPGTRTFVAPEPAAPASAAQPGRPKATRSGRATGTATRTAAGRGTAGRTPAGSSGRGSSGRGSGGRGSVTTDSSGFSSSSPGYSSSEPRSQGGHSGGRSQTPRTESGGRSQAGRGSGGARTSAAPAAPGGVAAFSSRSRVGR
jgi:superfamily II DNA/RNA helicase